MAPSTKSTRPGAAAAIAAEAAEEKYVSFTLDIQGTDIDFTVFRDPYDLPRAAMPLLMRRDPASVSAFVEYLIGPELVRKIDDAGATIRDVQSILEKWSEDTGISEEK